jgi:hypothetical protein
MNENIRVARRTDGANPVTNAKAQSIRIVVSILIILNLPPRKKSILNTNMLNITACKPETAIMCITPALIKSSF